MLRRNHLIVTAALVALCALPATAAAQQDLRMPDTRDAAAASADDAYQDLRSPDAKDAAREAGTAADSGPYVLDRAYGSPDAVDAARDLQPVQIPTPVVEVKGAPSGGFDWGDAGIGAAGTLALFSIAAGSLLLLTARKRRQGFTVAH
jgi:hypothetical protein